MLCQSADIKEEEDNTRYSAPDKDHLLQWSCEDKGVYTSADEAYNVLKEYHSGQSKRFSKILVLDCRYSYEYDAGHIMDAVSVAPPDITGRIHKLLFPNYPQVDARSSGTCMVKEASELLILVYCEFSSIRGPEVYKLIRTMDRSFFKYPWVKYRNLYLIKGGYEMFYKKHRDMCTPCDYVKMCSPSYTNEREQCDLVYELEKQAISQNLERFRTFSSTNNNAVEVECSLDVFF